MPNPASDEAFGEYVRKALMATPQQIAQACRLQSESAGRGFPLPLAEAMVRLGFITPVQRQAVEQKLETQRATGNRFGPYAILRKLGEGGMGSVYLAEDPQAGGRKVALKVLSKEHLQDADFVSRFRREGEAAIRLNHVNIVRAFTVGEEKGLPYYAMEYCEGEGLDYTVRRDKFIPVEGALDFVIQVARGLKYAHEMGFIHRDIKPDNIILTPERVVKILDLGLSKNIEKAEQTFNTVSGVAIGTPHYISPEQARGEKTIDGRTDIYSLGATFYHMVTGDTPFHGTSVFDIITKHLTEQVPDPRDLREEIQEGVVHVLRRMMAKKPGDRYADCGELLADLELLIDGKSPSSRALDAALSSVALPKKAAGKRAVAKPAGAKVSLTSPGKAKQRLLFGGLAAFALLGIVAVVLTTGGKKRIPETEPVPAPAPLVTVKPKPAPAPLVPAPAPLPKVGAVLPKADPIPPLTQKVDPPPPPLTGELPKPAPAAPDPPAPSTIPPEEAWKQAINLLPLVDPQKDAVAGTWTLKERALISDATKFARLEVPFEPAGDYDFRVVFTRLEGNDGVLQIGSRGGRGFGWNMGDLQNAQFAFESAEAPPPLRGSGGLENGRMYSSIVQVRKDAIRAFLDGKLIFEWKNEGREPSLPSSWALRSPLILGLGTSQSRTAFHRIEVLEGSGKGRVIPRPAALALKDPSLVGHWRLDDDPSGTTAADSSGHGLVGTLIGGPVWTNGKIGRALGFDGKGAHVVVANSEGLRLPGDLTLAVWVRKDAGAADWVRLVGKGDSNARDYGLWAEPGATDKRVIFQQYNATGGRVQEVTSKRPLEAGTWIHVAAVVQGENCFLYINGERDAEGTRTGVLATSAAPLTFGFSGYHSAFSGALDEIRLYNRALSGAEVQAVYRYVEPPAAAGPVPVPALRRKPVPEAARQREAEKTLRDLFKADYAKAAPVDKQALALKLLRQGGENADDPNIQYVLYRESRDLAIQAGDPETALRAVTEAAAGFSIDAVSDKLAALAKLEASAKTLEAARVLAEKHLLVIDEAVAADSYDDAVRMATRAEVLARNSKDLGLQARVRDRAREVQDVKREAASIASAAKTLAEKPDDPAANAAVGRFTCLVRGDWTKGLPLLTKGGEAGLKAVAEMELAKPADASQQTALADAWWEQAGKQSGGMKSRFQSRALRWYIEAAPQMTELTAAKTNARIKEYVKAGNASPVVSLLMHIDPAKDTVGPGAWKNEGGRLIADLTAHAHHMIEIPYQPSEEYDVRVVFTPADGIGVVTLLLSKSGKAFYFMIHAAWCGFGKVGASPADSNITSVKKANTMDPGRPYTVVLQVRKDGVRACMDGKVVTQWKTDYTDLGPVDDAWKLRDPTLLGIGCYGPATFHSVDVSEVMGRGRRTR